MSDIDDLRARVDRVEAELAEVRARAETAETLARFADRDTGDIKASHAAVMHSLSALRQTQIEQGNTLAEHSQILGEHSQILGEHSQILGGHSQILAEHSQILAEHSQAHAKTLAGIELIVQRLDLLTEDN
jgi:chromosome segregation ATPase